MDDHYGLAAFVRDLHDVLRSATTMAELLKRAGAHMRCLVSSHGFLEREFGLSVEGPQGAYLLYKDPEYGFVVNAVVLPPKCADKACHDHGEGWQVHGGYHGTFRITHYERMDDGSVPGRCELRHIGQREIGEGEVDTLRPFMIHQATNATDQRIVAITVHRHDLTQVWRSEYDIERKEVRRARYEPALIPPRSPWARGEG
jgi:predicted metal-dependent enzyme (double-stranded beta helix superfamily)